MPDSGLVADWGVVARAVHVLAVVVWIGGVWMVAIVLLPALRDKPAEIWLKEFEALESRFAPQARIAVLLVLLSGLYMLYTYDLWAQLGADGGWWMHLMVGVWVIFAAILFVLEPFVIGPFIRRVAASSPRATLTAFIWLHRILLVLSLAAIFGAVGGSHGIF